MTKDTPHVSTVEEILEEYHECLVLGDYKTARQLEPKILEIHKELFGSPKEEEERSA